MRHRPPLLDLRRALGDTRGATAVEFAMILGAMIFLTIGVINLSILIYTFAGLQSAAQNTARWAAIQATANAGALPTAQPGPGSRRERAARRGDTGELRGGGGPMRQSRHSQREFSSDHRLGLPGPAADGHGLPSCRLTPLAP